MKIALVIGGVDSSGGAERVMSVLANTLAKNGHDTTLMVPTTAKSVYPLADELTFFGTGTGGRIPVLRFLKKLAVLRKKLKQDKPDAIVSFMTPMNCIVLLMTRGLGIPVYVSERVDPAVFKGTFLGWLRSATYPLATGIVCQTEEARAFFKGRLQKKCCVIPNPLTKELREKQSYEASGCICAVGRLTAQKNYPLMFRAFASLLDEFPEYCLEIYGAGEMKDDLQASIDELGMTEKIVLKGTVPDIDSRIAPCDVFVMSSDFEGMSNALMEAMAVGLPCVATDCRGGGASFLLENEVNGALVPVGDEQALAAAIKRLLLSPELRKEWGTAAKAVRQRLSAEMVMEQWLTVLRRES